MGTINEAVFQAKNYIFRFPVIKKYRQLLHNQKLDKDSLRKLNWEKRKALVKYAYDNTVFYKGFYDARGFAPSMLVNEDDWNKVPILEKRMIRDNIEDLIAKDIHLKRLVKSTTGGSTGQPLKVYHDRKFPNEAITWRYLRWWGASPADNCGIIHRRVPSNKKEKLMNSFIWFPTKRVFLNASSFHTSDIEYFITDAHKKKVRRVTGYVGAVEKVAEYVLGNDKNISGIKHVWTTSAPLSLNARNKIEKAFGNKVMDQYGTCEIFSIAQQCPHCNGLHVNSDVRHVDIIDKNNQILTDYSYGDVLVTDLENFAFPFIKYRIGDQGNYLPEEYYKCSLPFPLLNFISGRISDTVVTPSGITLNGDYLTTIFDDYINNILAFQVHQKQDFSITIKAVVNRKKSDNQYVLDSVKENLKKKVNGEVPVSTEIVDSIPDDKGKTRYIISDVIKE